jgi:hypothetical protein
LSTGWASAPGVDGEVVLGEPAGASDRWLGLNHQLCPELLEACEVVAAGVSHIPIDHRRRLARLFAVDVACRVAADATLVRRVEPSVGQVVGPVG